MKVTGQKNQILIAGAWFAWFRLGRATDWIVFPIHSMLPPGTSATVAVVLSMVAVLMASWIGQSVVGGVFQVLYQISRSLTAGSPLRAIGYLLDGLVLLYTVILLIRILLSWFRIGYSAAGRFIRFVYEVTEPALARFRGIIPSFGGLDLSPILLFIGLQILRSLIRALFLR